MEQVSSKHLSRSIVRENRGQSLVESAIFLMMLVAIFSGMANIVYATYVGAGIASASRQAATYGAQGVQSATGNTLPSTAVVCAVAQSEMSGWLAIPNANYGVAAASAPLNGSAWTSPTTCGGTGQATTPTFQADPESAYFSIVAVRTNASLSPPISFTVFGKVMTLPTRYTGRTVYMRQIN
jgi:hypothetical protein